MGQQKMSCLWHQLGISLVKSQNAQSSGKEDIGMVSSQQAKRNRFPCQRSNVRTVQQGYSYNNYNVQDFPSWEFQSI